MYSSPRRLAICRVHDLQPAEIGHLLERVLLVLHKALVAKDPCQGRKANLMDVTFAASTFAASGLQHTLRPRGRPKRPESGNEKK